MTAAAENIIKKLEAQEQLTRGEELIYLTEIIGHTNEEAENIMAISENKDPLLTID